MESNKDIVVDLRSLHTSEFSGVESYTVNVLEQLLETDRETVYHLFYNGFSQKQFDYFHFINAKYIQTRIPNKILNLSLKLFSYPKIETLTDLISAYEQGPIDTFAVQFAALTNAQKLSLMRELEKSNPELYEKVAKTLRSRVKVGFESEEVLLGSEKKQNKGRKTVGYKNKPCDLKTILGTIKPQ